MIMPDILRFADALQTWLVYQEKHYATVDKAAEVFNVEPEIIVEAAEIQPYLALEKHSGDDIRLWTIGHDDPK